MAGRERISAAGQNYPVNPLILKIPRRGKLIQTTLPNILQYRFKFNLQLSPKVHFLFEGVF